MRRTEGIVTTAATRSAFSFNGPVVYSAPTGNGRLRAAWALLIIVVVATAAIADVRTQSSTSLGSIDYALVSQTFVGNGLENIVVVRNKAIALSSAGFAAGTSPPGVEAADDPPVVQTALVTSNYEFTFQVLERATDSWQVGDNFKIEVIRDGTVHATLYSKQEITSDDFEGVTVHVDSGSTDKYLYAWSIEISRQ